VRSATLRTEHDHPGLVAAALRPDHTASIETTARDGAVVTRVERETTGGLARTVDDYAVNLRVADRLVARAAQTADRDDSDTPQ
jgi:hypothetical protein